MLTGWIKQLAGTAVEDEAYRQLLFWFLEKDLAHKQSQWPYAFVSLETCRLVGGAVRAGRPIAAAWNILHLAAHLFDDIEDGDAVEGPDGLLSPAVVTNLATSYVFLAQLALEQLADVVEPGVRAAVGERLQKMLLKMATGQHWDLAGEGPVASSGLERYWALAGAKTGEFFGWAGWAGAMVGGAGAEEAEGCGVFGHNLGLVLQITDDWLDLNQETDDNDLVRGKWTLPLYYALQVAPAELREHHLALLDRVQVDPTLADEIRSFILSVGGLQFTLVQAKIHQQRARSALPEGVDEEAHALLLGLLEESFPL